jgi:hypothetical protein
MAFERFYEQFNDVVLLEWFCSHWRARHVKNLERLGPDYYESVWRHHYDCMNEIRLVLKRRRGL